VYAKIRVFSAILWFCVGRSPIESLKDEHIKRIT
jgi:hypothetical protein